MKTIAVLILLMFASVVHAQLYSAFFRYDPGTRIDFSAQNPAGVVAADTMTTSAVLHVLIPKAGSTATLSLTYGKGAEGREDQSYDGIVIRRTEDMITIVCVFGEEVDKIETYVIYPKKRAGFSLSHSAYFGRGPLMKALAEDKPDIPFGSATILRLRQFEE